mgnify:CR=1 FL=1
MAADKSSLEKQLEDYRFALSKVSHEVRNPVTLINSYLQLLEKDYPEKPHFLPNQHLLPDAIRYQTVGANSWITSDSFTDEKRVDGGVV